MTARGALKQERPREKKEDGEENREEIPEEAFTPAREGWRIIQTGGESLVLGFSVEEELLKRIRIYCSYYSWLKE